MDHMQSTNKILASQEKDKSISDIWNTLQPVSYLSQL